MPMVDLLLEELTELKIMKGNKVDHPRKLSKDLADAVCGAIFGAISHTPRNINQEVEIHTIKDRPKTDQEIANSKQNVIQYNRPDQKDIEDYLSQFNII
jgi:hypothetical protein